MALIALVLIALEPDDRGQKGFRACAEVDSSQEACGKVRMALPWEPFRGLAHVHACGPRDPQLAGSFTMHFYVESLIDR